MAASSRSLSLSAICGSLRLRWFMVARLTIISPDTRRVLTAKTAWVHSVSKGLMRPAHAAEDKKALVLKYHFPLRREISNQWEYLIIELSLLY